MIRTLKNRSAAGISVALLAVIAVSAQPSMAVVETPGTQTPGTDPADTLASAINIEVSKLPATASVEDIEAAIVFALSQGDYSAESIGGALDRVAAADVSDNEKQAIANVRLALFKKKLNRGTGAIGNGGGDTFGTSGFSAPIVSIGGGTSTYS